MARALESTLKYWLKSFSRDQFKLQGRTVQLSNIDISGDALHASLGLPPAITVSMAKSGKLEIVLPYLSNVQLEPIVVMIDKLDAVLEENDDLDARRSTSSAQASSSSSKGGSYGFAEKIADGMTLQIRTINLLLDTHGSGGGEASWVPPMASITIRNLVLYTTNENWQVVNLKAARDFSNDKSFIYVFKKLEWEYLCMDLLPHPDMFADPSQNKKHDKGGAKRVFFGGERFIDGISGEAYITIQRTEHNRPLGMELQVHITEAVCPVLSEPGLRAVLRFFAGVYVCLNRGDVTPNAQKQSIEAAGRIIVSFMVDHIFLGIKDAGFQLELLMQSLHFSRATVSDGAIAKCLTRLTLGGLILRDTFSRPPCPLVQPSMQDAADEPLHIPDFGKNFCPPIYPLGDQQPPTQDDRVPLMSLHCLKFMPFLPPPEISSHTVIECKPLTIHLQEESCVRISSFLADGGVVNPGDISPDISINSIQFNIKKLEITVPLEPRKPDHPTYFHHHSSSFNGARLQIHNLHFSETPFLKLGLLNLDMDAACFCLWEGQPIDASQKKWSIGASLICLSLETCSNPFGPNPSRIRSSELELWRCIEMRSVCIQVAMVTADGTPLTHVPPRGGVVRVGIACEQYLSNTSIEQLFFVLDLYDYIDDVSVRMAMAGISKPTKIVRSESLDHESLSEKVPADTSISVSVKNLKLTFLESSSVDIQGTPLVQLVGDDLLMKVAHRTLGAAMAISSNLQWEKVQVECAETDTSLSEMRGVFWVQNKRNSNGVPIPFMNISVVHVIPYNPEDTKCRSFRVMACIAGVRLAGGMNYNEALLHRFGILGPDGGPGDDLSRSLHHISSGPLSKLFRPSSPFADDVETRYEGVGSISSSSSSSYLQLDEVNISIELKDWIFALEGAERLKLEVEDSCSREKRSWHTFFESFVVKANGSKNQKVKNSIQGEAHKYPVQDVKVGIEGLKTLKPESPTKGSADQRHSGVDIKIDVVPCEDKAGNITWAVETLKFSAKQPIEVVVRKEELQHVAQMCKLEIDSMGRIAAGILRLLKLDGPVGQATLDQLSRLGSDGFEEIFSPRKVKTDTTTEAPSGSMNRSPSFLAPVDDKESCSCLDPTLASLEAELLESQSNCAELRSSESSSNPHLQQLARKLETMHSLLARLRDQVQVIKERERCTFEMINYRGLEDVLL
ncbi:unnamed protein product [Lactuca saligna]|uniref:Chorein N-terminal domain-containing protein n=1 Tax=Lactuca saligna TaxID=75948 RepID=A0AA35Z0G3_LACSI|nr:unnamed protein product [Lactuca saligna]CAI9283560.1 unnamed protein product [Lactuca saligna]